jgi:cytochrome P450
MTDRIVVAKKTTVSIPIAVINRNKAFWGEDAWDFRPDRWLEPLPAGALEIPGYRHLTSFLDGPKVYVSQITSL